MITIPKEINGIKNSPKTYLLDIQDKEFVVKTNISYTPKEVRTYKISKENILELLIETGVSKGYFNAYLVFVDNNGILELTTRSSNKFKEAIKNTKISIKDIDEGDEVVLRGYEDFDLVYLGSFYRSNYYTNSSSIYTERLRIFVDLVNKKKYIWTAAQMPIIIEKKNNHSDLSHKVANLKHFISSFLDYNCFGRNIHYQDIIIDEGEALKKRRKKLSFQSLTVNKIKE